MPRTINFEGRTITVPDDFNDDEISSVLAGGQPHAPPAPVGSPSIGPDGRPTMRPDIPAWQPPAGTGTAGRGLKIGVQGAGQGLAELAGAPVDLTTAAINLGTHGINKVTGAEIPAIAEPFGGSQSISNAATKVAGMAGYEPVVPDSMREKIGYETNRFGANIVGTKGIISALPARAEAQIVPRVTGMQTQAPTVVEGMQRSGAGGTARTAAGDAMGAAGAGTTNALYHEGGSDVMHNMPGGSVIGPVADFVVPLVGGVGGAGTVPLATTAAKGVVNRFDKLTGRNLATDLPVDPVTGRHYTNKDVDAAATVMQGVATNPARAAAEVGDRFNALSDAGATRNEMPPATAISDPGVASLGAAMKQTNPVLHAENAQRVNSAARQNLDQSVPQHSDPHAFPQRVGEVADQRTARAQEDVTRAEDYARRTQEVRQGQAAELPAEPQTGRVAASEALDRQIIEHSLDPMDAQKRANYAAIPNTPVQSEPLHELAADIRRRHQNLPPHTQGQVVPENALQDIEHLVARDAEGAPILDANGNATPRPVGLQDLNQINNNVAAQIAAARANNAPIGLIENLRRVQGRIREMVDQHPDAAEATRYYAEEYGPVYGRSAGEAYKFRQDVNKDRLNRTASPPSETGKRFMGANAPENTDALHGIVDTITGPARTQTHAEIRNYLISDMAASGAVAADGTLRPMALQRWADRNSANLDLAPGVRDEVAGFVDQARRGQDVAGRFADELRTARQNLNQTEAQHNRGAFKGVIGADPEHAVASIFSSSNPEAAVQELLGSLGPHFVEARNGLKAAVRDYLLEKASPKVGNVSFNKLDEVLNQHRDTLRHIYSPEEMHALETAHNFLAPFRNLEVSGTAANVNSARMSQEAWRMLEAGMKIRYGMLKGGGITRTLKTLAATLPSNDKSVSNILKQMQFDPELAQHLLTRDVSEVNSPMWTKRLFQLMGTEEAARNSNRDERRQ